MTQNSSTDIQAKIDKVTAESANFIGRIETELETARSQQFTEDYQQKLRTDLTQARAMYEGLLNRLENELSVVRIEEAASALEQQAKERAKAAETKEQMYTELKRIWMDGGGDRDVFEKKFPELYEKEMSRRTLSNAQENDRRAQQAVIHRAF